MQRFIRYLVLAAAASMLQVEAASAYAESIYPIKPIHLIVGYPPGGATDATARLVASKLGAELGQPVVVENKPGVGGTLGTAQAAQAAPDGYTLLMGSTTAMSIAPHLYKKLAYDPRRDFVPVALVGQVPQVLVVNPASIPATNLKALIEWHKKTGGALDYASFGNGSTAHLTMEMLGKATALDLRHIPYKGSGPAMTDVIGGQVPMAMDTLQAAQPHIRAGKLRAIAMSAKVRSSLAPDLPTFAELGYPAMTLSPWYGVFAPAGTPDAIVDKLAVAIARTMSTPDVLAQLARLGTEPLVLSGAAARAFLDTDAARWAEAARISGARLD